MKRPSYNNCILALCVAVVLLLCLLSVRQPVHFQEECARREASVKQRLLKIRDAEENYRRRHGVYTGDLKALVRGRYLADSLQYIPYAGGQKFQLAASATVSKSGRQVPLMECSAPYEAYLSGLDEAQVAGLTEQALGAGLYPGLKIGDITTNNDNASNW